MNRFAPIPNEVLRRRDVTDGAKLCYARVLQYAGAKGHCYPSQATLAVELGKSVRQVRRHLAELEALGFLSPERRGQGRPNIYRLPEASVEVDRTDMAYQASRDGTDASAPKGPDVTPPIDNEGREQKKRPEGATTLFKDIERVLCRVHGSLGWNPPQRGDITLHLKEGSPIRGMLEDFGEELSAEIFLHAHRNWKMPPTWPQVFRQRYQIRDLLRASKPQTGVPERIFTIEELEEAAL